MNFIFSRFKVELILLALATLIIVGFIVTVLVREPAPSPTSSPIPQVRTDTNLVPRGIIDESNFSSFFTAEIGKTTQEELRTVPGLREIPLETPGSSEFISESAFSYRDNAVITEDSIAAFKRIVPVNPQTWQSPQISYYQEIYGIPEFEKKGSVTYGDFMTTYVYASKGFAAIFNPFTGEVFEVQSFAPTTVEDYLQKWGSDITSFIEEEPGP